MRKLTFFLFLALFLSSFSVFASTCSDSGFGFVPSDGWGGGHEDFCTAATLGWSDGYGNTCRAKPICPPPSDTKCPDGSVAPNGDIAQCPPPPTPTGCANNAPKIWVQDYPLLICIGNDDPNCGKHQICPESQGDYFTSRDAYYKAQEDAQAREDAQAKADAEAKAQADAAAAKAKAQADAAAAKAKADAAQAEADKAQAESDTAAAAAKTAAAAASQAKADAQANPDPSHTSAADAAAASSAAASAAAADASAKAAAASAAAASAAEQANTAASGANTQALGDNTAALGANTKALGDNTAASGANTKALGDNTAASGANTKALGDNTAASGANTKALGDNTAASGANTKALSDNTTAVDGLKHSVDDLKDAGKGSQAADGGNGVGAHPTLPSKKTERYYTAETRSINEVLTDGVNDLKQKQVFTTFKDVFSIDSYSCACPIWRLDDLMGFNTSFAIDVFCTNVAGMAFSITSAVLQVLATFMAIRIAMGGWK